MSQPKSLRLMFQMCRPIKLHCPSHLPSVQARYYANTIDRKDIPVENLETSVEKTSGNKTPHLEIVTDPINQPEPDNAETPPVAPRPVPPNVLAAFKSPLKHPAPHGVPVASLQLRSFSVRNLEFFADFALRAAFYLNLPVTGPVPLPKRRERWTVTRSNFVNKKSQENFERITYKRLITVLDGEKSAVEVWLAVLRKWQFWGVGMKANVWEWEGIDVASRMDAQAKDLEAEINTKLASFGFNKVAARSKSVQSLLKKHATKSVGMPMAEIRQGVQTAKSEI